MGAHIAHPFTENFPVSDRGSAFGSTVAANKYWSVQADGSGAIVALTFFPSSEPEASVFAGPLNVN
jgi:hypothetical protein